MSNPSIISIKDLNWSYNGRQVLKTISMNIKPGTFTGILGPNGAGKTTLLKLILRLLSPEKDSVLINQRDVLSFSRKELARHEAHVPQSSQINFDFTVEQIILMGRSPYQGRFDRETKEDREIAERAMKQAGIFYLKDKLITRLSGGEGQRVIVARALAQEPELLALDEPTSHLDIHHQIRILSLIRSLSRKNNLTVLAVLHDINHALEYCDFLFLLDEGTIYKTGCPEEVITPRVMKEIYGLDVQIAKNPYTGKPFLIPEYE